MDLAEVIAAHVVAERMEGNATFERLATLGTFEVSCKAGWEGVDLMDCRVDPKTCYTLFWFARADEAERVGSGDVEWSNTKDASGFGWEKGRDGCRLVRFETRKFDRDLAVAESFQRNTARRASPSSVGDGELRPRWPSSPDPLGKHYPRR